MQGIWSDHLTFSLVFVIPRDFSQIVQRSIFNEVQYFFSLPVPHVILALQEIFFLQNKR